MGIDAVLRRNRSAHLRDRDLCYQLVIRELDQLLELVDDDGRPGEKTNRKTLILSEMTRHLRSAVEHAVMAKGGVIDIPAPHIELEEIIFLDFLETLYREAKYILSVLRRRRKIIDYIEAHSDPDEAIDAYVDRLACFDGGYILRSLKDASERIRFFNKLFPQFSRVSSSDLRP